MGNFYTNIVLFGATPSAVLTFLREKKRSAYVLDAGARHTVIFDEKCDSQDIDEIHSLGSVLSKELCCSALASLNHDDDILYVSAYAEGELVTEYESSAGRSIHPFRLCRVAGITVMRAPLLFLVLELPHLLIVFEIFRHMLLAKLLSLPRASIGSGYTYIDDGEPPVDHSHHPLAVVHTLNSRKPPRPIWER